MKKKGKKGQSALEFIVLFSFVLLFMIVFLVVLRNSLLEAELRKNEEAASQIADFIKSEVQLADASFEGYKRTFYVPPTINGIEYDLKSNDGVDIVINYKGNDYVFFFGGTTLNGYQMLREGADLTIQKSCPPASRCLVELIP